LQAGSRSKAREFVTPWPSQAIMDNDVHPVPSDRASGDSSSGGSDEPQREASAAFRSTILVVDDDRGFRRFMSSVLERAGYSTIEAATGEEAVEAARKARPAVVLLDVKLPGVHGYEVCRQLKETIGQDLPVFLVSGVRTEAYDRAAGLLIGADESLAKPVDPDELLARVRKYAAPEKPLPEGEIAGADLTKRELEILRLLAEGLTQGEIAQALVISEKTVATHIQHVLEKLGVHSRAQAVALAHRSGLMGPPG
jgi:DNA-binding NarL/FixJ family response regulator